MAQNTINPAQKKIPVARVNGVVISEYEVEAGLQTILEPFKDPKGKVRLSQPEQYGARIQVIDNLVMRELLYQEGCRRAITATAEELQHALDVSMAEQGSEQQFKAMLLMIGLTPAEYTRSVGRDIVINKLAASLVEGKRKPVTTADAKKYYHEHLAEMQGAELRRILHIMIPLDRYASPEDEKKVRRQLEKIGESRDSFNACLNDPRGNIRAENLGFIMRSQFHPLLASLAFRIREGEISRIIRTDEGLHLLLVTAVLEEGKPWPFDLIEEELKKRLYEMNSVAIVNGFVEELKKKARIEILDRMAASKLEQEKM